MASFFTSSLFIVLALFQVVIQCHEGHGSHDHSHAEVDESAVVVLGEDNFDETISKNEFVFVEFYAPWCGHCKHLVPEYAQAALTLKAEGSPAVVGKVDATIHSTLAQKFGVRGYPTLKFFKNGVPVDYDGQRTAQDIISFIRRKSGPASTLLDSKDAVESFKARPGTQIIAHVDDSHSHTWLEAGKNALLEAFGLGHVTDSSLHGDHKSPSVHIWRDGEDKPITYSGDFKAEDLVSWASVEGHPLVGELEQQTWQRSQQSGKPLLALFYSETNDETAKQALDLATKYKGQVMVTVSKTVQLAERWGTSGKKFPTAILVKWSGEEPKFVIFDEEKEDLDATTADNFVTKALSGEYTSYKKSEPVPETNDGPVKTVVGKTFESIVYDNTKTVLVEFYAPWCGHCKKLAPIWEELGSSFTDSPSVVIAKVDATANTVPDSLEIRGFPTIIVFPKDNKSGVLYEGERDLKNLKKFVEEHASGKVGEVKEDL